MARNVISFLFRHQGETSYYPAGISTGHQNGEHNLNISSQDNYCTLTHVHPCVYLTWNLHIEGLFTPWYIAKV